MNNSLKKYLYWSAFMLCFWGIPVILIGYAIFYLHEKAAETSIEKHQTELNLLYSGLLPLKDSESFWCRYFTQKIDAQLNTDEKALINRLEDVKNTINCDFVLYSNQKGIIQTSFNPEPLKDWQLTASCLRKIAWNTGRKITKEEEMAAARIIGPQFNWEHVPNSVRINDSYMIWGDSVYQKPLFWVNAFHDYLVIIIIRIDELHNHKSIWKLLNDFENENPAYGFAFADAVNSLHFSDSSKKHEDQLISAHRQFSEKRETIIRTPDLVVFPRYIKPDLTILGYVKATNAKMQINPFALAILAVLLIAAIVPGKYAHSLIIREIPDSLSIKWKLRFLFFFANGIPLMVLFFIGTDYLNHKRDNLLRETHNHGISYLQDFDEKVEIEFAKIIMTKKKAEMRLMERLATEEMSHENMLEFTSALGSHTWKVAIIASRSSTIGTDQGIIDEKRGIYPADKSDSSKNQLDFIKRIGQFFLDKINGARVSEKVAMEIELLIESVTQKPLNNFIYDLLIDRGKFIQWGFGQNVHPAILDTFYLPGSTTADYFFLTTFRSLKFFHHFLTRQLAAAERNNLGMRIVALHDQAYTVPQEAFKESTIREFSTSLTSYPSKEVKIVKYDGQNYLIFGFEGRFVKDYKLMGLCPLDRIDSLIDSQKSQLLIFAMISLLITLGLSQILAQSFLLPLQLITDGAKAIETKNFDHRLPELGRDEFGAMGSIFNNVMVDLEELSVASAIQEQLLPQGEIPTGNFSLYGRSVSMGALGGDYFDHIALDNNCFSVLLGDVAGHGVGAALIMAMAKAGVIQSEDLLNQPQSLMARLHNLILASKTKKQRKVMTFQYLFADGSNGRCLYANAGACSPILIRGNATVAEELTLAGAALGAFKKANFSEIEVSFAAGDAIVFYTDGIVEARNSAGEELGYENLKTLLKNCWDINAEIYYQKIFQAYLDHIGDEGAQDDLTMVVLVYRGDNV